MSTAIAIVENKLVAPAATVAGLKEFAATWNINLPKSLRRKAQIEDCIQAEIDNDPKLRKEMYIARDRQLALNIVDNELPKTGYYRVNGPKLVEPPKPVRQETTLVMTSGNFNSLQELADARESDQKQLDAEYSDAYDNWLAARRKAQRDFGLATAQYKGLCAAIRAHIKGEVDDNRRPGIQWKYSTEGETPMWFDLAVQRKA